MSNIKDAIEFTIKNLDLRIERAQNAVVFRECDLKYAKRDNDKIKIEKSISKIKECNDNIDGYNKAEIKLRNNGNLSEQDIKYILKSLNIRMKRLNENLGLCNDGIKREKQALIDKKDKVSVVGGFGVSMKHYDDVSISVIANCEKRISNITKSLDKCNTAIKFFKDMK